MRKPNGSAPKSEVWGYHRLLNNELEELKMRPARFPKWFDYSEISRKDLGRNY